MRTMMMASGRDVSARWPRGGRAAGISAVYPVGREGRVQLSSGRRREESTGIWENGGQLVSVGGWGILAVGGVGQRGEGGGAMDCGRKGEDGALAGWKQRTRHGGGMKGRGVWGVASTSGGGDEDGSMQRGLCDAMRTKMKIFFASATWLRQG